MSRELIEFSNRIDEQFEPAPADGLGLWIIILSWFK